MKKEFRSGVLALLAAASSVPSVAQAACGRTQMEIAEERVEAYSVEDPVNLLGGCGIGGLSMSSDFDFGGIGDAFNGFLGGGGACGAVGSIADKISNEVGVIGRSGNSGVNGVLGPVEDGILIQNYQQFQSPAGETPRQPAQGGGQDWDSIYDLYNQ